MRNLGVFVDNVLVGTLHDTDPLSLTHTQDCLSGLVSAPFSALISLDLSLFSRKDKTRSRMITCQFPGKTSARS